MRTAEEAQKDYLGVSVYYKRYYIRIIYTVASMVDFEACDIRDI